MYIYIYISVCGSRPDPNHGRQYLARDMPQINNCDRRRNKNCVVSQKDTLRRVPYRDVACAF